MNMSITQPVNTGYTAPTAEARPVDAPGMEHLRSLTLGVAPPAAPAGTARVGLGELAGRQISVGSGQAREASMGEQALAAAVKAAKFTGKGLGALVAVPVGLVVGTAALAMRGLLQLPRLINQHALEPRADARFEHANGAALASLRKPAPGSLALSADVMGRVEAHARAQGTPLTPAKLTELVAVGENLAHRLANDEDPGIASGQYTTRALAWFMMAEAAKQDGVRATAGASGSDMVTSGSFVMKDPGNKVYNFLASAPTAASRMSTHFEERVGHGDKHLAMGFIPTGKPAQRGIEDYQNMLPGSGGTMLFDRLAARNGGEELFVKFESVGCPPYFNATEPHHGTGQAVARFFSALDRNIGHATDFAGSLMEKFKSGPADPSVVKRQEHVYKGVLKNTISEPFAQLVKQAVRSGVIDADCKALGKSVHKLGLPFIEEALNRIQDAATTNDNSSILTQVMSLRRAISDESARLGLASDQHGIERRGAEVHISIDPTARLQAYGVNA
jgi:hypothetical protein